MLQTQQISTSTPNLRPVQGHSTVLYKNQLFVFGGRIDSTIPKQRNYTNELWILNLANMTWKQVAVPDFIVARHNHSAIVHQNSMICFGGSNLHAYLQQVVYFDLDLCTFANPDAANALCCSPRHGHSAHLVNDDTMIVFGGKVGFGSSNFLNDTWKYNVSSKMWTIVPTSGTPPSGRCWHSSCVTPDQSSMLVFGGFYFDGSKEYYYNDMHMLHLQSSTWSTIECGGLLKPHVRNRNGMIWCAKSKAYIIFCGNFLQWKDEFLDDIWMLTEKYEWVPCKQTLVKRGHFTVTQVASDMWYVIGGEFDRKRFNDVFKLQVL